MSESVLKRTLSFRLLRFSEISKAPYHLNRFFLVLVGLLCIFFLSIYPEGSGNSLQCSCLENPMERGTLGATVHGVARVELDWLWLDWPCIRDFPGGSVIKNPPASAGAAGDSGLIPGLERYPGGGNSYPFSYSACGKSHGCRSLVCYIVHGIAERWAWLSMHTHVQYKF